MDDYKICHEDSPWMLMELDWSHLTDGKTARTYKKGYIFYEQDEESNFVYVIKRGRVALRILDIDGGSRTIITLDEGCIFGNLSLFDDRANSCRAISVSDTVEVYALQKSFVLECMNRDPLLMQNMLLESNRVNRILTNQLKLMTFRNAESIVCFYLMHMANQYSEVQTCSDGEHKRITMKFTHQDIADVTGLSRVSVSNIISSLVKQGILDKSEKRYVLLKQEEMESKIAYY